MKKTHEGERKGGGGEKVNRQAEKIEFIEIYHTRAWSALG